MGPRNQGIQPRREKGIPRMMVKSPRMTALQQACIWEIKKGEVCICIHGRADGLVSEPHPYFSQ